MEWRVLPASRFGELSAEWNALQEAHAPVAFLRSSFISAALDTFGCGREVIAVYGSSTAIAAMGIFTSTRLGVWQTFQPSQLPLGAFLANTDVEIDAAMSGLLKALPGLNFSVALTQQDSWLRAAPEASNLLESLPYIETAWVNVDTDFASYWAARGKNLRQNVKRQLAKLAAQDIVAKLEVIEDAAGVTEAIEDYGRLESAGWKSEGGTAVGRSNAQGRFYETVFANMCRDGLGRIYRYRLADRVAAMDLCVAQGGVMIILKTAYDESFKSVSPASLMRYEYFRPIFDEHRVRRIEFYGQLMEWHTRWTEERRSIYHLNRFRWPWLRSARKAWRIRAAQ